MPFLDWKMVEWGHFKKFSTSPRKILALLLLKLSQIWYKYLNQIKESIKQCTKGRLKGKLEVQDGCKEFFGFNSSDLNFLENL